MSRAQAFIEGVIQRQSVGERVLYLALSQVLTGYAGLDRDARTVAQYRVAVVTSGGRANNIDLFGQGVAELFGVIRLPDADYRATTGLEKYTPDQISIQAGEGMQAYAQFMFELSQIKEARQDTHKALIETFLFVEEVSPGAGEELCRSLAEALSSDPKGLPTWLGTKAPHEASEAFGTALMTTLENRLGDEHLYALFDRKQHARVAARFNWPPCIGRSTDKVATGMMLDVLDI